MRLLCLVLILFFQITNIIISQPDSRFRAFDWTLIKGSGIVNSITEGYTNIYIGTSSGGVKRFNKYSYSFSPPITSAQGLKENNINAVHFDKKTGILWVASNNFLHYSYSREGNWYIIKLSDLNMYYKDRIEKIGSTNRYIWLAASSTYLKIDHTSGTFIGVFPIPDELNISWSSGTYIEDKKSSNILINYSLMDGYIYNGGELIDNLGRRVQIRSFFYGEHDNIYFGTDDGTFFNANKAMQIFSSYKPDIENIDVSSIFIEDNEIWVGSQDFIKSKGVSKLNVQTGNSIIYNFEEMINMTPTPIYSICKYKNEVWFGGDDILLLHNVEKNYWRTFSEENIGFVSKISDLYADSNYVWISSNSGLNCLDRIKKEKVNFGPENIFSQVNVNDMESVDDKLWIGTQNGPYVISLKNPGIFNVNDFGRKNFQERIKNVSVLKYFEGKVYIACQLGIVVYDYGEETLNLLYLSGIYNHENISSLAINKNYIFLGTKSGLIRIEKKTGTSRFYDYEFLQKINDMTISENLLYIGTSKGLVKFKWKRDV